SLWGWSLVLTNMIALPLMNAIGMFLEESEEQEYAGIVSFIFLSYLLVPFQAYASVKGFLEKDEGGWFRTPKTGRITDVFRRGTFYRFITGLFPWGRLEIAASLKKQLPAMAFQEYERQIEHERTPFVSRFRPVRPALSLAVRRRVGRVALGLLLIVSVSVFSLAQGVSLVYATPVTDKVLSIHGDSSTVITSTVSYQIIDGAADSVCFIGQSTKNGKLDGYILIKPNVVNSVSPIISTCPASASGTGWVFDTPFDDNGYLDGNWTFDVYTDDNVEANTGYVKACVYRVAVTSGAISASTLFFEATGTTDVWVAGPLNSQISVTDPCSVQPGGMCELTATENYLYVDYYISSTGGGAQSAIAFGVEQCGTTYPQITIGTFSIPENIVLFLAPGVFIPALVKWRRKRRLEGSLG
ncbi:hypothetical protein MUP65_00565, partial [Patescibacteria group bacterium]|nr:hypothetical protein [Patescibacteria group bacterium]